MAFADRLTDEEYCNLVITLIHQTDVMLRKLPEYEQDDFLNEGGVREQMSAARRQKRRFKAI